MKFCTKSLMIGAVFAALAAQGRPPEAPQQAGVNLASRSIRLASGAGVSSLSVVFSTAGAGGRFFGNGELRPSASRPGFYEAGYVVLDNSGDAPRRVEAGTVFVTIPDADADGDTVPDSADLSASVNLVLPAEAVPNASSPGTRLTQPNFTVRLLREGNSEVGGFATDLLPTEELSGEYAVLHAEGSVTYRRTDTGALLDFSLSNATENANGSARLVDADTVRTAAFRLRVNPTRRVRVGPAVLVRAERFFEKGIRPVHVYRGEVAFSDGWDETAASDFRSWVMQIEDRNDDDDNGVPNFSDTLRPYIAVQPRRVITGLGDTATLSVVVTGTGPFTFEWQQNGHELSNAGADATSRVLTLRQVTADDVGSYRVYIRNAAGTVVSESTSLSLRLEDLSPTRR